MRLLAVSVLALCVAAGPALASEDKQDADWTGVQLGVLYGYSWMQDYNNTLRLHAEGDGDVMGVYAAANKQFGALVGGVEVSYARHDNMFTDGSGVVVENVFAAKLRAGVARDRVHIYGTAGLTHGTTNLAGDDWGAVFGFGLDVLLTRSIVAGAQYNYYTYTNFNDTTIDAQLSELSFRLGYKF
ncbi:MULTISPECIES: outer membrane beta-barrel protein [unclassified Roseitalea]|uniref:outer membrane protein n=1 Tax=unclassified Roseitalea TaxID=2639107 RepID=UPI00273E5B12|nr:MULTISPECIES: outer membrane beta-barrel protein [unclassified Roseitalea]